MRRRYNKQESSFKQTNREDNHTPSTQIISIVTVICAMNLDIKLLNVMCNEFGHKVVECKLYAKKSTIRRTPFQPYLG